MEETREVITMQELAARFKGKYVDIESSEHYKVSIELQRGTVELSDLGDELYFVSRDYKNIVTGSMCVAEDAILSITEEEDGSYFIDFLLDMAGVYVSECKIAEQLEKAYAEKEKENLPE